MALIKGTWDGPALANSYADVNDCLTHFPSGIGIDGKVLAVEYGINPADAHKAAQADHRLIAMSRWIDGLQWDPTRGQARITSSDDASTRPPLLALPPSGWTMGAGNTYIREGSSLNTDPSTVPWVIIAAVCEGAEVMRVNGCFSAGRTRHPADVLVEEDVHGHLESEWAAPLAAQLYETAHRYLMGLVTLPGRGRKRAQY
jgi:hypothetical protein